MQKFEEEAGVLDRKLSDAETPGGLGQAGAFPCDEALSIELKTSLEAY